jgi:hypothetical protein
MQQFSEFPKMLYNAEGEGEVANSRGEEARLEALGYQQPKTDAKASKRAFDRAMRGAPPEEYRPEEYPKWIEDRGHEPVLVTDAAAEDRIRRSWSEEEPEPAAAPLSVEPDPAPAPSEELFKAFLAWKESRATKRPRSPAAK